MSGEEPGEINARLTVVLEELVPFFQTHCKLSEMEAAALSESMTIHDKAVGQPSAADIPRIAYLESVFHYARQSRAMLNSAGLGSLLGITRPAAESAKAEPELDEKPSVLKQIRDAQKAPKTPRKEKTPGKDKNNIEI